MSKTFGLKFQSRVLRSLPSASVSSWVVATNNLREENEIRILEFDEKSEALISPLVYVHQEEVWDLAVSARNHEYLATTHSSGSKWSVTLWKRKDNGDELEKTSDLCDFEQTPRRVLWRESDDKSTILVLEEAQIKEWDVTDSSPKELSCGAGQELDQFFNMHLPEESKDILYITNHHDFQIWDLHEMKLIQSIKDAHEMPIKALHTSGHFISTCGDDCLVKIWDNRKLESAMMVLRGHSHWVWDCNFNPKHHNLLLSCSSDFTVVLWDTNQPKEDSPRGESKSSSVMYDLCGDDSAVHFTDHDESVYCVDWSLVDDWIFASLSYDGRVAVNKVPSEIKYRILI